MDSPEFLQHFNDLSDERVEERCRAAEGILKVLRNSKSSSSRDKDISYAAKRLIRGCTSGRRSCRQGFCLAVVELLRVFPAQTTEILQLIKQTTEVQSGMRQHEQKDRLLGRLFAHIAILEARAFSIEPGNSESSAFRSSKQQTEAAKEIGEGLQSVCSARPYLRAPSISAMSTLCQDLCAAGAASQVPEILAPWGLESATSVNSEGCLVDAAMAGLVLDLRVLYEKGVADAHQKDSYRSWPSLIKKDIFAEPPRLTALAKGLSKVIEGAQFGDAFPQTIQALCAWLLHSSGKRNPLKLQDVIWPALDDVLFGPDQPVGAQAQGLTALVEIAACIKAHSSAGSVPGEALLVGLFGKFTKGVHVWLTSLNYSKAVLHRAAAHTQFRFQKLIVGSSGGHQAPKKRKKKGKQDTSKSGEAADKPWPLGDETRLQILDQLQKHSGFASTPKVFRLHWQASLIAPLSAAGVRSLCTTLLRDFQKASPQSVDKDRAMAERLGQLALHGNAPDAAILAVICTCFSAAYCIPQAERSSGYPLSAFVDSLGVQGIDTENLIVPVPVLLDKSNAQEEGEDVLEDRKSVV